MSTSTAFCTDSSLLLGEFTDPILSVSECDNKCTDNNDCSEFYYKYSESICRLYKEGCGTNTKDEAYNRYKASKMSKPELLYQLVGLKMTCIDLGPLKTIKNDKHYTPAECYDLCTAESTCK